MEQIRRTVEPELRERLSEAPAVVLLGPRQVGKTTLARQIAGERGESAVYLDLERPADLPGSAMPTPISGSRPESWSSSTRSTARQNFSQCCVG